MCDEIKDQSKKTCLKTALFILFPKFIVLCQETLKNIGQLKNTGGDTSEFL